MHEYTPHTYIILSTCFCLNKHSAHGLPSLSAHLQQYRGICSLERLALKGATQRSLVEWGRWVHESTRVVVLVFCRHTPAVGHPSSRYASGQAPGMCGLLAHPAQAVARAPLPAPARLRDRHAGSFGLCCLLVFRYLPRICRLRSKFSPSQKREGSLLVLCCWCFVLVLCGLADANERLRVRPAMTGFFSFYRHLPLVFIFVMVRLRSPRHRFFRQAMTFYYGLSTTSPSGYSS
jgi:hypothetical protein